MLLFFKNFFQQIFSVLSMEKFLKTVTSREGEIIQTSLKLDIDRNKTEKVITLLLATL